MTIDTQHISHFDTHESVDQGKHAGTGRPPPNMQPSLQRYRNTGRPGILGRKQHRHRPADPKNSEVKGRNQRFEPNTPNRANHNVSQHIGNPGTTVIPTPAPVNRTMPMLMSNRDLPGPLSMNRLDDFGALHRLDDINAYLTEYSDTLFGRGIIMTKAVPSHSIACGRSALWVWMGGRFPDVIDIISGSHFRSMVYGRPIKTYDRSVPEGQMSTIAGLKVTSPTRTACDIALMDSTAIPDKRRAELICAIVEEYHIDSAQCLEILERNHFWPNMPQARQFFKAVQYCL